MAPRALLIRSLRQSPIMRTTLRFLPIQRPIRRYASHASMPANFTPPISSRSFSSKTPADEVIEDITELYATAQDEFEIAMEETQKLSVYAEEDRKAAREEFNRVQEAFKAVVEGQDRELAEEVKRRIGQRMRELEQGVVAMEELALNQD